MMFESKKKERSEDKEKMSNVKYIKGLKTLNI